MTSDLTLPSPNPGPMEHGVYELAAGLEASAEINPSLSYFQPVGPKDIVIVCPSFPYSLSSTILPTIKTVDYSTQIIHPDTPDTLRHIVDPNNLSNYISNNGSINSSLLTAFGNSTTSSSVLVHKRSPSTLLSSLPQTVLDNQPAYLAFSQAAKVRNSIFSSHDPMAVGLVQDICPERASVFIQWPMRRGQPVYVTEVPMAICSSVASEVCSFLITYTIKDLDPLIIFYLIW
ncbi:unnamed protein product [Protopolystoma xenopodis]|uniref:Uncharacterized protein n=1 Tax=Protopolystoma xenopodis TaxID=117903 RepID=A0A3S5A2N8_9PLAT|nr:unnamed protein product [Protopolystoma xenopodis]